ncbi:MAG: hypothetical protein IPO95_08515 [Rhodanobacteraceae bacterium]|nr:hypothetical protein [Rhodanobacteraceae bacterium]
MTPALRPTQFPPDDSPERAIAGRLFADIGGTEPADEAWILHALTCFPIPTARQAPYLFAAFLRLVRVVPWASNLLPADGFLTQLHRLGPPIHQLIQSRPETYGGGSDESLRKAFQGDFRLAGTIHGGYSGLPLPAGLEALRTILLWCRWSWLSSGNPKISVIEDLASAIRGAGQSSIEPRTLLKIGQAKSLPEFIEAAAALKTSAHETLAQVWRLHVEPELLGVGRPAPASEPTRPPEDLPAPPHQPSGGNLSPNLGTRPVREVPEFIDPIRGPVRFGTPPRPDGAPEPLPAESVEEVTPSVLTTALAEATPHADAEAVLRYQAQQAIWGANRFLLPNHPDVLQLKEYIKVVTGIVSILSAPVENEDLHFGTVALLVMALMGRTPKTLTALEVLADKTSPHDPHHLDLLLAEGALRLSAFWQVARGDSEPSFFRPSQTKSNTSSRSGRDFLLPIAPPFMTLLRANADRLRSLAKTPLADIERCLRLAAQHLRDTQGSDFTVGQLRASLAAHLFEDVRDTAAVQLICIDTIGQSVPPLSYYAPKVKALAATHWAFQEELLGEDLPMPMHADGDERVGARLIARLGSVKAMARAPTRILKTGMARLLADGRVADVHRAMVHQVAGMLMAVATHRPTEALLALTLSDLWIDGDAGTALFRDKIHDAAHDPRLVALPATLCGQINAYLSHLAGLAERIPGLTTHIEGVLHGRTPLLFELSDSTSAIPLDLARLKEGLPEEWRQLPLNWGRHWMRTHAVEQGVRPELVSMQLGHLDAVGYPFSRSSPTEPWLYVREVARDWEPLVRKQGWQCVAGISAKGPVTPRTLTPLRSWASSIRDHEQSQRETAARWREALRARLRSSREGAETKVLEHPELISAGIVERFHDRRRGLERHAVKREDFERIRDEVFEAAGDDLALALAQANAVCRIARIVNGRTRQISETPGKVLHLRRPLDNAFVPGMMEAVRQVHALREHIASLSKNGAEQRWSDLASACACTALALVLFGGCEYPEQIWGALERRAQLARSANLQDVVLLPAGHAPHQVLAFRGTAAIVLSRLAWKFQDEPLQKREEVDQQLTKMLPNWALDKARKWSGQSAGHLGLLCETIAVANRYERSPAARRANAPTHGSTPAHIREQLAFIDGDPAGTVHRIWEAQGDASEPASILDEAGVRKGNARSQYLKLCAAFPSTGKDTDLPLTRERIASGEAATPASYVKVVAEIEAQMRTEEPALRLHPIVRMLAAWTSDMLVHGTPLRDSPALSTVKTYLTRIGGTLVYLFAQSAMTDVDDVELEDAYLCAVDSTNESRQKTAAAVLAFHRFAIVHFGLPEIDLSAVQLHLSDDVDAQADARLVLPRERTAILSRLAREATRTDRQHGHAYIRKVRQANLAMPLFAFGGMRRGEAMGIQFRDVGEDDNPLRIRVRPNRSRRLKTANARRFVELPLNTTRPDGASLAEWVAIERQRLGARRLETAYVFTESDQPFDAKARGDIAAVCIDACREVTGRRRSRLHAFRHLVAIERVTPAFLTESDLARLAEHTEMTPLETARGAVILPRDLHARVISLGHGDAATTLDCYHHLPSLLHSRTDAWLAERFLNRAVLAPLLGVTSHTLDWAIKQRPGRDKGLAWLDVAIDPRTAPKSTLSKSESKHTVEGDELVGQQLHGQWSARALGELLAEVERIGSLEKAFLVKGADVRDANVIRAGLLPMERRLGRRIIDENRGEQPRRVVRRIASAQQLEMLWDRYDNDHDGERTLIASIAEEVYDFMAPKQADRICLSPFGALQLRTLISRLGVEPSRVVEAPDGNLSVIRLLRTKVAEPRESSIEPTERFLGLVLKRVLMVIRFVQRRENSRYRSPVT